MGPEKTTVSDDRRGSEAGGPVGTVGPSGIAGSAGAGIVLRDLLDRSIVAKHQPLGDHDRAERDDADGRAHRDRRPQIAGREA